jgi:hypothetical protein
MTEEQKTFWLKQCKAWGCFDGEGCTHFDKEVKYAGACTFCDKITFNEDGECLAYKEIDC